MRHTLRRFHERFRGGRGQYPSPSYQTTGIQGAEAEPHLPSPKGHISQNRINNSGSPKSPSLRYAQKLFPIIKLGLTFSQKLKDALMKFHMTWREDVILKKRIATSRPLAL